MLHDRLVQSDSAQSHHCHPARRVLPHHQSDDDQYISHVRHVTRYDLITPQRVYSQRPTLSSTPRACGQSDVTPVPSTVAQWPYIAGYQQSTSTPPTATFWDCSLPHAYTAMPHHASSAQSAGNYSSTDVIVPSWPLDADQRLSAEMTSSCSSSSAWTHSNSELNALTMSTQTTRHNEQHRQLSRISTLSQYPHCDVSSYPHCEVSSSSFDSGLVDDDATHQFGTRPTRASTSIGTYLRFVTCHNYLHKFYT